MELPSTREITSTSRRINTPGDFLKEMSPWFDASHGQILKLETRQEYDEGDNPSLEAFEHGDLVTSKKLLIESKADDIDLYEDLNKRGVDFIRCRVVKFPMNQYTAWEIENYKIVESYGERVFLSNWISTEEVFENYALHDFMVFDARAAFIHDYDEAGKLQGGWMTTDQSAILKLQALFTFIKSMSARLGVFT